MIEELKEKMSNAKKDSLTYKFRALRALEAGRDSCVKKLASAGKISVIMWMKCIQELHQVSTTMEEVTGRWDNLPTTIVTDFERIPTFTELEAEYCIRKKALTNLLRFNKIDRAEYAKMCQELQLEIFGEKVA